MGDIEKHTSSLPIVELSGSPWYKNGLSFGCTGCGKCCTGFPGAVWVSDKEVEAIGEKLNLSSQEVEKRYTRVIGMNERRSLQEVGPDHDCIFLQDKKRCQIYDVRPTQCKTYPWWPSVVETEKSWEEAKEICEGIEHPDAPLISQQEIDAVLQGK